MAVVLLTGGSSGIGLATVRRLAAAGHQVFAVSRNPTRAALPEGVTPMTLDVGNAEAAAAAVASVVDATGRIDVLVNNAAISALGPLEDSTDIEAHRIFEVNVFGPLRLARSAVRIMRGQGSGRIINVTSMNDVVPSPFAGWYSASKAALASASAVLDAEVHEFGIFVTVVAPGFFRTDMAKSLASFRASPGSAYRSALEGLLAANTARLASGADPDEVAVAIEECIGSADPPGRIVVGTDAIELTKLVHDTSPDDFTGLMRSFVAGLARRPSEDTNAAVRPHVDNG